MTKVVGDSATKCQQNFCNSGFYREFQMLVNPGFRVTKTVIGQRHMIRYVRIGSG